MHDTTGQEPLRVAILGSGNIGTDLLLKVQRSPFLACSLFIGRNPGSIGMVKASSLGVRTSDRSIQALVDEPDCCDLVFDATSAMDHAYHWSLLQDTGIKVLDLTPSRVGPFCIPALNLQESLGQPNVNLVTCGGQASVPLARAIADTQQRLDYVEVVSSIASQSAGPATRRNIDEYVSTTQGALARFSGAERAKAILILNPARPCIDMQTTVFAKTPEPDMEALKARVAETVAAIQSYVPGYRLLVGPLYENGRIVVTVKVEGLGDYLPRYAGNLDIITCAAVAMAEAHAAGRVG